MKIFFDTEFTGLHKNTTLISIGLISEDGRQFYGELTDYDDKQCDNWIKENVICNLFINKNSGYVCNYHIGNKINIRCMLLNWLKQFNTVEFISDVCHYDMVLLVDLLSNNALDLPSNISSVCHDINQDISKYYGISEIEAFNKSREDILFSKYKENNISGDKHNSMYDAKLIREIYQIVN